MGTITRIRDDTLPGIKAFHGETKRLHVVDNPFDTAKAGEMLEIINVTTGMALIAYDPDEKKVYGANILYPSDPRGLDTFFKEDNIPKDRRTNLKILVLGSIPVPKNTFGPNVNKGKYAKYRGSVSSEFTKAIEYMKGEYKVSPDQIIRRDAVHETGFMNFDTMAVTVDPKSGTASLYARRERGGRYEEIETIKL